MNVYVHALFSTAPKKKHDTNSWSAEHLQPLFSSRHFSVEIKCIVLQHPCDTPYTNAFIAQHRPLKETMLGNILGEMSNETTSIISSCLCQTLYCSLLFTIQSCEWPITNLIFLFPTLSQASSANQTPIHFHNTLNCYQQWRTFWGPFAGRTHTMRLHQQSAWKFNRFIYHSRVGNAADFQDAWAQSN